MPARRSLSTRARQAVDSGIVIAAGMGLPVHGALRRAGRLRSMGPLFGSWPGVRDSGSGRHCEPGGPSAQRLLSFHTRTSGQPLKNRPEGTLRAANQKPATHRCTSGSQLRYETITPHGDVTASTTMVLEGTSLLLQPSSKFRSLQRLLLIGGATPPRRRGCSPLTDYKVVVLTFSEQVAEAPLQVHLTSDEKHLAADDDAASTAQAPTAGAQDGDDTASDAGPERKRG